MPTVVLSPFNVANYPEGGGHWWVYLQYVLGLRACGCDVWWLERFVQSGDEALDRARLTTFQERMRSFGLRDRHVLYTVRDRRLEKRERVGHVWRAEGGFGDAEALVGLDRDAAETLLRTADLLINFHYAMDPSLLARFRRTALVDIDPGLLQLWMRRGQLAVHPHDVYFTIAETIGTEGAAIPDAGHRWVHIRPPVSLEHWPAAIDPDRDAMTCVSGWNGGDWIADGEIVYENTKRASFLEFIGLPGRTRQPLELALCLDAQRDAADRSRMERDGWRIRLSDDVAGGPEAYRRYVMRSRGEFGCAKPFHVRNRTAWVSDRTVCYLASGKPVVVQDTGPSDYLPNGDGMFRFSTVRDAARALDSVNEDYERHCRAARTLAETCFDARRVVGGMLEVALD